jgi:hypothetical protein
VGDYKPQVGNRYRVTFEGDCEREGVVRLGEGWAFGGELLNKAVSVEKIEPPVEVFGPGDVVRRLVDRDYVYALGDNGYTNLTLQHVYTYNDDLRSFNADDFTSKSFERVTLS